LKIDEKTLLVDKTQVEIDSLSSRRNIYADFASRASLSKVVNEYFIRVISKAERPIKPFKPNLLQNIAIAISSSVLLVLFVLFLLSFAGTSGKRAK
jgi:uncharacterized protein involved in exopolysaccharide biosynthesis